MARSFNGSSDYLDCGAGSLSGPLALANNHAVTICGWVNAAAYVANGTVAGKGFDGGNTAYQLFQTSSNSTYQIQSFNGAVQGVGFNFSWSTGTWHHVLGQYDGAKWYIYGDGSLGNSAVDATGPLNTAQKFEIGAVDSVGTPVQFFQGNIADVAIWNVALSTLEIAALAKGARPFTIRASALIGWWPIDDLQSPEPDLSGNKNNGTVHGTASAFGPPFAPFTPRWAGASLPPPTVPASLVFSQQTIIIPLLMTVPVTVTVT